MTLRAGFIAAALFLGSSAQAQDGNEDAFVEANILSIFYHELGHALIDVMDLPVFGQEEDAADTASILLIDATFDNETAQGIAYGAAFGFVAEAELSGDDIAWWDEHGPDLQRFYNLVCLFYGANPEIREDFVEDMGLPEERAEYCADEYDLAISSWGPVFDEMLEGDATGKLRYTGAPTTVTDRVLTKEVAALNAEISLPVDIAVTVTTCDEANAYYDPETREITMCLEFEPHLRQLAEQF